MWSHPGKQLLFMGQEFGQTAEWSEERGLDWYQLDDPYTGGFHRGLLRLVHDLNATYREHPALWTLDTSPGGFSWIDANDTANNVLSFLRYGTDVDPGLPVQFLGFAAFALSCGLARTGRMA